MERELQAPKRHGMDWMGYSGSDLNTGNNEVVWRLKEDANAVFGRNSS